MIFSALLAAATSLLSAWPGVVMHPTTPVPDAVLLRSPPYAAAHREFISQMISATAAAADDNSTSSLTAWLDTFIVEAMGVYNLPSVGVGVVDLSANASVAAWSRAYLKDQNVVSKEGRADQLLFRIASITKSITATAVMMLVQDKLIASLDDDIGRYLRTDLVPADNLTPISLRQLLTHTAGYEEQTIAQLCPTAADLLPLHEYLVRVRPPQHFPAGAVPAYSNFGFSLLGRVVELLANQSYEAFVRERIFAPLNMTASVISPRDPAHASADYWDRVAPQVAPNPADPKGDGYEMGAYVFQFVPAGQVMLTPDDMVRYARFHLSGGQLANGTQLLDAALVAEMHSNVVLAPLGIGYGFVKTQTGGNETIVMHDGDMPTASSRLLLVPGQQRAIFISFGKGQMPLREKMTTDYGKLFVGGAFAGLAVAQGALPPNEPLVQGTYSATRQQFTGCLAFVSRISATQIGAFQTGDEIGLGAEYESAQVRYKYAANATHTYVQTINPLSVDVPDYFAYPYLVSSRVNGTDYAVLIDPLAGWYHDDALSGVSRLVLVLVAVVVIALALSCLLCSCCYHQCFASQSGSPRLTMVRSYPLSELLKRTPNRTEEGTSLTAGTPTPKSASNERKYHDIAVYCYTPFVLALLFITLGVYGITVQELGSSFPSSSGAFVFFPFAFLASTIVGLMCSVGACLARYWWVDRRVTFALMHLAMFVFAIVWSTVGGGLHDECWH